MRKFREGALVLFLAVVVAGQSSPPSNFDVASIKPIKNLGATHQLNCAAGRFVASGQFMQSVVQWAYGAQSFQLSGEKPTWFADPMDSYNIEAKADGVATSAQCKLMVRTLLEDRFKLKLRHETKEFPVFALVVGKGGAKLREVKESDDNSGVFFNGQQVRSEDGELARGWSMRELAQEISGLPSLDGRPVVDQTGLQGRYAMRLDFALFADPERPDIRAAVGQQLGLRLESSKAPFEVLVIEHIERPSGN